MNIQPPVSRLHLGISDPVHYQQSDPVLGVKRYVPGLMLGVLVAVGQGAIATAATPTATAATPPATAATPPATAATLTVSPHEARGSLPTPPAALPRSEPLMLSQSVAVQRGDQGGQVEALQKRLSDLGYYSGPVTGFFGEMTEDAVIRFQQAQGLTADGIVGTGTATALRQAGNSPTRRANNPLTLEVGDQGPSVTTLQNQLTQLDYYDGPVTGYFGSLTEAALIRFQSAQGLVADGIVGSATQAAIDRRLGRTASAAPNPNDGIWESGETGATVTTIQRQLQLLGYYDAPIDGDFGSNTEAAVRAFQRSRSLTVDGKVGPQTLSALNAATQASATSSSDSHIANLPPTTTTAPPASSPSVSTMPTVTVPSTSPPSSSPNRVDSLPQVSNEAVLAIQRQLRDQGFYNGALDGQMGSETRQAIREAQQSHGLQLSDFSR
ncbi:MAG: peptidoglycan-binding protein [Leptolyngbyaceae cyanobacterium]